MEDYQWGGVGKNEEKGTGNKKRKWQIQNRQEEVKVQEMEKPNNLYIQPRDMN